jgi:dTDP-4-amino-4,6-dideoxygalactose transaminase
VIDSLKNFGIASETSIPDVGTNAKMSELHAAMGVLQLAHFDHVRACRAAIASLYRELLAQVPGITVPVAPSGVEPNYAYFPVLVEREFRLSRDDLYAALGRRSIHARRYFYPLLSTIPAYVDEPSAAPANLPIANEVAAKILCLPIFPDLSPDQVHMIVDVISGG